MPSLKPACPNPLDYARSVFATTQWTVVLGARGPEDETVSPALLRLCQTYWPPLYAFLRREGYARHDAEDLVQGFFLRFLERDFLRHVDRDKGRFRSFLLVSLRHYVANERRDERTQRRGGGHPHIALNEPGVMERCEASGGGDVAPETAFDRTWAETVMEQAARRLRAEYAARDQIGRYEVMRVWLAQEPGVGDYARLGPLLGLTEGALAAAVFRMRQRFRQLVREEVAHTVQVPEQIGQEMRYLLEVLTDA